MVIAAIRSAISPLPATMEPPSAPRRVRAAPALAGEIEHASDRVPHEPCVRVPGSIKTRPTSTGRRAESTP